jgi:hypothetical protein
MNTNYAFIQNNNVVNIAVFDDPTPEMLEEFRVFHNVDEVVLATDDAAVGGTYVDGVFTKPIDPLTIAE